MTHHQKKLSTTTSNCFTSAFTVFLSPAKSAYKNSDTLKFQKGYHGPFTNDRLALRYSKDPVNPRYRFSSTTVPWSMKISFPNCFFCQLIFLEMIKFFFHSLYQWLIHLFVWILFCDTRASDSCSMNFIIPR